MQLRERQPHIIQNGISMSLTVMYVPIYIHDIGTKCDIHQHP